MPSRSVIAASALAATLYFLPHCANAQAPVHVTSWPTVDIPLGIAVGPDGLVYVGAQHAGSAMAHVYTQAGDEVNQIGGGSPETYGLGFLGTGELLIARYYDARVDRFTVGGVFLGTWNMGGSNALYLAVDPDDNVYVTDDNGDRVRKVNSAGVPVANWPVAHPSGIAFLNGKVYVAGMFSGTISVFLPDGTPAGSFPTGTTWAEQLSVDNSGNLLLADVGSSQLKCFEPDGTVLWTLGPNIPGYVAGSCKHMSVAQGPNGTLLVGDYDNRRILVLGQQPTAATSVSWGHVKSQYRR